MLGFWIQASRCMTFVFVTDLRGSLFSTDKVANHRGEE
jgi:hypothetical protein